MADYLSTMLRMPVLSSSAIAVFTILHSVNIVDDNWSHDHSLANRTCCWKPYASFAILVHELTNLGLADHSRVMLVQRKTQLTSDQETTRGQNSNILII